MLILHVDIEDPRCQGFDRRARYLLATQLEIRWLVDQAEILAAYPTKDLQRFVHRLEQ